ncbi:MAG TPA: ABC transporter permease [Chryseolinea sp.]|nr:ABC transporter permease [Chryseolinea sp.]
MDEHCNNKYSPPGGGRGVPPKLGQRLLMSFLRNDLAEEVQGDLEEKFLVTVKNKSRFRAQLNYWYQVMNYLRPFAIRKAKNVYINDYAMFQSYFKIGWRNILKYKTFSFINVFGLALAMSVCMLIILMLGDQTSYDNFHEKADRTYRVLSKRLQSVKPNASSPHPLAETLKKEYQIVEETTTLTLGVGGDAIYNQKSAEMRGFFAEPSFFNVFGYELKYGNMETVLDEPGSIVITDEFARLLFGNEDAIGKTIEFVDRGLDIIAMGKKESPPVDFGTYTITGVIADENYKSHLKFDALVSSSSMRDLVARGKMEDIQMDWATYSRAFTYVVLAPGKTEQDLSAVLNDVVAHHYKDIEHLKGFRLLEQKLTRITPGIFVGNPTTLSLPIQAYYFLSILATVIMLSACLNYIYLSTARALTRAKEIGVRKVVGAYRRSLIFQFLSESVLTAFLSMVIACGLLFLFLKSAFLNLWVNRYLHFDLQPNIHVFLYFVGFALIVGLLAGCYPAFYLSRYQPILALKNAVAANPGRFRLGFRRLLSGSQLMISLFFITTSILVFKQFKHFLQFNYDFNAKNIVNIPVQGNAYQLLSTELSTVPGIQLISACSFIPATGMAHGANIRRAASDAEFIQSEILQVDENFFANLELRLFAGEPLSTFDQSSNRFVVNEAAVKALGYEQPSDVIGELLDYGGYEVKIIGVVKDFRFQTPMMQDKIGPLMLCNQPDKFNFINAKIDPNQLNVTLKELESKWRTIDPHHPFKYKIFEDELNETNQSFGDMVAIIGYISFLAISIACMGLLGMTIYATERRTKEIGIRKILGATERNLTLLLSKQFLVLLLTSVLISAPLTYLINNLWLQNFPNKVAFGFDILFLGVLFLMVLGLFTICSQTFRAARKNPVNALKME